MKKEMDMPKMIVKEFEANGVPMINERREISLTDDTTRRIVERVIRLMYVFNDANTGEVDTRVAYTIGDLSDELKNNGLMPDDFVWRR